MSRRRGDCRYSDDCRGWNLSSRGLDKPTKAARRAVEEAAAATAVHNSRNMDRDTDACCYDDDDGDDDDHEPDERDASDDDTDRICRSIGYYFSRRTNRTTTNWTEATSSSGEAARYVWTIWMTKRRMERAAPVEVALVEFVAIELRPALAPIETSSEFEIEIAIVILIGSPNGTVCPLPIDCAIYFVFEIECAFVDVSCCCCWWWW